MKLEKVVPVDETHKNIAMLKELVQSLDGDRLFLPSTASGPNCWYDGSGVKNNHDVHGPWKYSGPDYGYLNGQECLMLGEFGNDGMNNMTALKKILAPENLVLTRQIHSDIVRRVGRAEAGAGLFRPDLEGCDGLITNEPGIGLVAFAADCTPVLLWDPETGAVGAVHAGWRGTANRIAAKAVRAMTDAFGTRPEHLRAAIGPNIGPCCFETDADVPEAILASVGPAAKPWIRVRPGGKFDVDLKSVNRLILEQAGVRHIDVSTDCTACRPDRFWSHRRVGAARGAQGAVIVCRKEEPA